MSNSDLISGNIPGIYGTDLDWLPASADDSLAGNLRLTSGGDMATVSGPLNVLQSRIKELTTPYGYYGRYVRDYRGVQYIGIEYGNPSYLFLSEPSNTLPLKAIAASCQYVMMKDVRVANCSVHPDIIPDRGLILIRIDFALADGEVGSFQFALNPPLPGA